MPAFAICRSEKIKDWATFAKSVGHNLRTSDDQRRHLNTSATEPNRVLCGSPEWAETWPAEVASMHLRKLAQGQRHTLVREFFLGMSPGWAEGKSREDIEAWAVANVCWLRSRFGAERVKLAVLHLDEQTPHLAAYVVPLTADTNRSGQVHTDRGNGWTLSDRVLGLGGTKDALVRLQDEYAVAMEPFALSRGRRNSKAKHQTVAEWRRLMAEPLASITVPKPPEATLGDRIDIEAYGRRVAKATSQDVFRQFKPMQMQAKEVPTLRRQIASLLAEVGKLQPLIDVYKGQKDFLAKLLARLLGIEPDLTTQQGIAMTVE
ncbi:MAG: plasmid recombination protein, partial [Pseudomonadota bacterium]|nr:plasmid recombination protein [Pseudomonadota bacterium]